MYSSQMEKIPEIMNKNRWGEVAPKLEEGPKNHQKRKEPKKEIMKMRWRRLWGRNKGPEEEIRQEFTLNQLFGTNSLRYQISGKFPLFANFYQSRNMVEILKPNLNMASGLCSHAIILLNLE